MTHAERSRLGGLTTFRKYSREHMQRIAVRGFVKLAASTRGGRKAALGKLVTREDPRALDRANSGARGGAFRDSSRDTTGGCAGCNPFRS